MATVDVCDYAIDMPRQFAKTMGLANGAQEQSCRSWADEYSVAAVWLSTCLTTKMPCWTLQHYIKKAQSKM